MSVLFYIFESGVVDRQTGFIILGILSSGQP
jgi:hypothetical protein